jgi:hypothetical protein
MTWFAVKGRIYGSGHVVFKKAGVTLKGPSFAADTRLKQVVIPAPGSGSGVITDYNF